jgi:hypothetical protein
MVPTIIIRRKKRNMRPPASGIIRTVDKLHNFRSVDAPPGLYAGR